MKVARHEKAKVPEPRQNQDKKTVTKQLGGARKQFRPKTDQDITSLLLSRMVTRLGSAPKFPPAYNAERTYTMRHRWVSAEAVSVTTSAPFTLGSGHRQFLVALTTTSGIAYADMWRIKKIFVWTINYVDNATTATIYPVGSDIDSNNYNDREDAYSCSSRSEAEPGRMCVIPARDTPLGGWHKTSTVNQTGVLFNFGVDYGGASSGNWATVTMDIEFEYVPNLVGAPNGFTQALSGAPTAGTVGGANLFSQSMLLTATNVLA